MSNSIFSSPVVSGVALGAAIVGVAVFGGQAGTALEGVIEGAPADGWQKMANTVLDGLGGGLKTASTSITEHGEWMAEKMGLEGRVNGAVLPAIAAIMAGTALKGLVNVATTTDSPAPGGMP